MSMYYVPSRVTTYTSGTIWDIGGQTKTSRSCHRIRLSVYCLLADGRTEAYRGKGKGARGMRTVTSEGHDSLPVLGGWTFCVLLPMFGNGVLQGTFDPQASRKTHCYGDHADFEAGDGEARSGPGGECWASALTPNSGPVGSLRGAGSHPGSQNLA